MCVQFPTPIEILQEQLSILKSARRHSIEAYVKGMLDEETRLLHERNLFGKISIYENAIKTLRQNGFI